MKEPNEQWEYRTFTFRHSFRYDDDSGLNKLGQQGRKALPAIAMAVVMCLTACEQPRKVDRTVELHYINGEVETRTLRGYTNCQPVIYTNYGTPNYNDGNNRIYGVVRFQVLRVDTLEQKGGPR